MLHQFFKWRRGFLKFIYLFIFLFFIFISCRLITLQFCSGFCHTLTWISHGFTCIPHPDPPPPPSPSHPSGSSQCTSPEHLSHASNLGWRSVSHLIVYLFQSYSLRTNFPGGSDGKASACNAGDLGSIPGLEKISFPPFPFGNQKFIYF